MSAARHQITINGLTDVRAILEPELFAKAYRRTVNDMIKKGRTKTSTTIREKYTVKASILKKHMSMDLVSPTRTTGRIVVKSPTMALTSFAGTRGTNTGVSIKIKKAGSRKIIKHAFIGPGKGGVKLAFQRKWRRGNQAALRPVNKAVARKLPHHKRYPLVQVSTLGPTAMFNQQYIDKVVQEMVDRDAQKRFATNYDYFASKV